MATSSENPTPTPELDHLQCMEVFGGHGDVCKRFQRPGLDVWIASQTRRDTAAAGREAGGGDMHLISSCASGRVTRMLIADVCGLGPVFHDVIDRLRGLMRQNVNSIKQVRVVRQMSEQLAGVSRAGGLVSTLLSTYFAPTRMITLCNAGHPPPLLFRRRLAEWSIIKPSMAESNGHNDNPLALNPRALNPYALDLSEYQQLQIKLEVGDMILAFSNSLSECLDRAGHTIGLEGLRARLAERTAEDPSNVPTGLLEEIRREDQNNLLHDDATVLLCQATSTAVGWRDNLLAPFRLLRPATDRTVEP